MKKVIFGIIVLSLLFINGCVDGYECGKYTNSIHEKDVITLSEKICKINGCEFYSVNDICNTGKYADEIICNCDKLNLTKIEIK